MQNKGLRVISDLCLHLFFLASKLDLRERTNKKKMLGKRAIALHEDPRWNPYKVPYQLEETKVISLFSGCGGLDLGFQGAGFKVIWANENNSHAAETYSRNNPEVIVDSRPIQKVPSEEIPDCIGVIGGPPCQSWSAGGAGRGLEDERGSLFLEYIRVIESKQPLFFVCENVPGLLHEKHREAFVSFLDLFLKAGYQLYWQKMNAHEHGVAQLRHRVIFVGFKKNYVNNFSFPSPSESSLRFLQDAIGDLKNYPSLGLAPSDPYRENVSCPIPNHEHLVGDFSSRYMSRNRVKSWGEPSFTVVATGRSIPLHPDSSPMVRTGSNSFEFKDKSAHAVRRLSVRECARIQSFPDWYQFFYPNLAAGYRMVGNAVPPLLSLSLATAIYDLLDTH